MAPKTKSPTTVTRTESRTLACPLDSDARLELGARMARASESVRSLKEEKAELGKSIAEHTKTRDTIGRQLYLGTEDREIRCEWHADAAAGTETLIRTDTGEVLETRARHAVEALPSPVSIPVMDDDDIESVPVPAPRGRRPRAVPSPDGAATPMHHEYPSA